MGQFGASQLGAKRPDGCGEKQTGRPLAAAPNGVSVLPKHAKQWTLIFDFLFSDELIGFGEKGAILCY